jgi:hypothetical protein
MQPGKILPVFRQFFSTQKADSTSRDSNSQQGHQQPQDRNASEEEAHQAAEMLRKSDEFKKNGLIVRAELQDGKAVLLVTDSAGSLLRVIRSHEVFKILLAASLADSRRQGRILDRRI